MRFAKRDHRFMEQAIAMARAGIAAGQTPFGAVIVREGKAVAATHNTVWRDLDPTAHAEVACIRQAAVGLASIHLDGCSMYCTCEPCPMCLSAIHWSKIDRVIFGAEIADAAAAGFRELHIPAGTLVQLGQSSLRVEGGLMRDECARLFDEWREAGLSGSY